MGNLRLYGATSGYTEISSPDSGMNQTVVLPASGDVPSVVATAIEPTDPTNGDIWVDITNSNAPRLKIWDGSSWIVPVHLESRFTFTSSGGETSISGSDDNANTLSYIVGYEKVFLNGVLLVRSDDYTASNGTSITGLAALTSGDVLEVFSG